MQRLVYNPKVQAFIMLEGEKRLIDVTNDIVNGTVNRRLNAMSDIQLTLQNKDGQYTQKNILQPMDRIIVKMCRVGDPFLVFSGFLDDVPFYQLYPGTVTLAASDTLKLLHNTYFDPGLVAVQNWFIEHGWTYDPNTGTLGVYGTGGGVGNDDLYGNMRNIITAMLTELANWPKTSISIYELPSNFLNQIANVLQDESQSAQDIYQQTLATLNKLYGSSAGATGTNLPGGSGGTPTPINPPPGGNVSPLDIAKFALAAGFTGEAAIKAVAIALAESSGNNQAMNYNPHSPFPNGTGSVDSGLWQINSVHGPSGGTSIPAPNDALGDTTHSFSVSTWNGMKSGTSTAVANYVEGLWDPATNATAAYSISTQGTNFGPWATYNSGAYKTQIPVATIAVNNALVANSSSAAPVIPNIPRQTSSSQDYSALVSSGMTFAGIDQGIDFTGPGDIYALGDGSITRCDPSGTGWPGTGAVIVYSISGETFGYIYNAEDLIPAAGIGVGSKITKGQVIAHATGSGLAPGVEIGWADASGLPVAPRPPLRPASQYTQEGADFNNFVLSLSGNNPPTYPGTNSGTGNPGGGTTGTLTIDTTIGSQTFQGTVAQVSQLGAAGAFYTQEFQSSDVTLAQSLTGERSLAACVPIMEWLDTAVQASGRVYCSAPNGSFLSFFPDRFGLFARTPYFHINDIEIIDLTVNKNDTNLVTHVFTSGPQFPASGITLWDRMNSMVASIEDIAFRQFVSVPSTFKPLEFLARYGARPYINDIQNVNNPLLLWMHGWMKFMEFWSQRFTANASFTFMPELFPGGLVSFVNEVQMFIESVTHTFDLSGGFSTTAELSSITDYITNTGPNPFQDLPAPSVLFGPETLS